MHDSLSVDVVNDSVKKEIALHIDPASKIDKTYRKNALLAKLDFQFYSESSTSLSTGYVAKDGIQDSVEGISSRTAGIIQYFVQESTVSATYGYMKPYVEALDWEEKVQLRNVIISFLWEFRSFDLVQSSPAEHEPQVLSCYTGKVSPIFISRFFDIHEASCFAKASYNMFLGTFNKPLFLFYTIRWLG